MNYWLMKSEPDVFGIDHLARAKNRSSAWDGVRNYQVRNMLRDEMQVGDLAFFYHSSCAVPGIAGVIKISRAGYPDHTALDPENGHYDPRSTRENPVWYMVDVTLVECFPRIVTLAEMRADPVLQDMLILRPGNRLSITPVAAKHWKHILKLAASR
ncbi:MAG TPA: EVE domain-containing protein [Gammaproteobacteria bacterium]|nr:EVE domain-containing protein [Gammaproteobacteria bacterium]